MLFRTSTDADIDRVRELLAAPESGGAVTTMTVDRFDRNLGTGHYRPQWIQVAEEDDGRIVAAALLWGFPDGRYPLALDALLIDDRVTGAEDVFTELVRAAIVSRPLDAEPLEYHVFLPGQWRTDAAITAGLTVRLAAAAAAGLTEHLERFRYEWTADMGVPARSTRLRFRPEPDDEAWVTMFADVAAGSLDAATRAEVDRLGVRGYAAADVELYKTMPGDRSWWKFAYDTSGDLVGFAMPSRNDAGPVVGFLGVLPAYRGRGYADDLLAEITADLADLGAQRIVADTDATNTPMAASFDRAGYHRFGVRLVASPAGF
jgi:RimJ/RimL family protein N-acetyltransferase